MDATRIHELKKMGSLHALVEEIVRKLQSAKWIVEHNGVTMTEKHLLDTLNQLHDAETLLKEYGNTVNPTPDDIICQSEPPIP